MTLPPLPDTDWSFDATLQYTDAQMRDYARACMCPLLAEIAALREQLATFTPLRARGVVDADDNLDCWDTDPFEICHDHVAALNEKDPAAMWRVVELFWRDLGPNVRAEPETTARHCWTTRRCRLPLALGSSEGLGGWSRSARR